MQQTALLLVLCSITFKCRSVTKSRSLFHKALNTIRMAGPSSLETCGVRGTTIVNNYHDPTVPWGRLRLDSGEKLEGQHRYHLYQVMQNLLWMVGEIEEIGSPPRRPEQYTKPFYYYYEEQDPGKTDERALADRVIQDILLFQSSQAYFTLVPFFIGGGGGHWDPKYDHWKKAARQSGRISGVPTPRREGFAAVRVSARHPYCSRVGKEVPAIRNTPAVLPSGC